MVESAAPAGGVVFESEITGLSAGGNLGVASETPAGGFALASEVAGMIGFLVVWFVVDVSPGLAAGLAAGMADLDSVVFVHPAKATKRARAAQVINVLMFFKLLIQVIYPSHSRSSNRIKPS